MRLNRPRECAPCIKKREEAAHPRKQRRAVPPRLSDRPRGGGGDGGEVGESSGTQN